VLQWSEAKVLAYGEIEIARDDARRFRELMRRRMEATPVAYLLGEREFWGRAFAVDARVLIPRPETEHLIEVALQIELPEEPRILEIGTGSGCLAITLALEIPEARVVATDLSVAALALARRNTLRHGVQERIHLVAADLLCGLQAGPFDLIISNPPYVAMSDADILSPEVRDHEPGLALFAEGDGTRTLGRLLRQARGRPYLALEIGAGQEEAVQRLAVRAGWQMDRIVQDLAGIPRTFLFSSPE
jgi:release factor glutamine methyltransferase